VIGRNRVVITGLGVLAANGIGKEAFWNSLLAGESGIDLASLFTSETLPPMLAGEIPNFDVNSFIARSLKPKRMGRFTQLALVAADEAIRDSAISREYLSGVSSVPIIIGTSSPAMDLLGQKPTASTALMSIPNAAASAISYANKIAGQIQTISNGCASSLDAIANAFYKIQSGQFEIALAGGADSTITEYVLECFTKARKLPEISKDPGKSCKPFDLNRTGGVVSEGAVIFILENEQHAISRGAPIYCRICGYGSQTDPAFSREGKGFEASMLQAINNSALRPRDINYINAHAPGDIIMDYSETVAIKSVFSKQAFDIPISSIKGITGSAMGTGGAHQLVSTILALKQNYLPHTANLETRDPDCDLDYIMHENRKTNATFALVNTHGFGRSNGSLIIERMD
jgi:3-oxoacyl-[acyl-carrier-protein] synthase II